MFFQSKMRVELLTIVYKERFNRNIQALIIKMHQKIADTICYFVRWIVL